MKKLYEEPIVEIRNYALPPKDVVMTSFIGDGGQDDDDFDYFD